MGKTDDLSHLAVMVKTDGPWALTPDRNEQEIKLQDSHPGRISAVLLEICMYMFAQRTKQGLINIWELQMEL
jgi:hypothetical protein